MKQMSCRYTPGKLPVYGHVIGLDDIPHPHFGGNGLSHFIGSAQGHVRMLIDDSRGDKSTGRVDHMGSGRHVQARSDRLDATVDEQHVTAGDLFSSFVKRRLDLASSSMAIGLDHIPESFFPLLASR